MTAPTNVFAGIRASHAVLHDRLAGLDDATARRPSLLPGWTVGHVVTHIARNADSVVRRLAGAVGGRLVPQYPGGLDGRTREIEDGAGRSAAELLADLVRSDDAVDAYLP